MNLYDTCPIKIETSVKDVFVIKTSGIHSGIHAPIHGELPTLHPTFNAVIILTSAIMTKLLDDHFGQTLTSPRCCPLNPFYRPCRPSQRKNETTSFPPHDCGHWSLGLGLSSVSWAENCLSDHYPRSSSHSAYPHSLSLSRQNCFGSSALVPMSAIIFSVER